MLPSAENRNGYDQIPRGAWFSMAQNNQLPCLCVLLSVGITPEMICTPLHLDGI